MDGSHWKGVIVVLAVLVVVLVSAVPAIDRDAERRQARTDLTALEREGQRVYERYCVGCHGAEGDGNGPSAKWLEIKPRDFRSGVIRFASVDSTQLPRISDLARAIRDGLPGSAMPAWRELAEEEVVAVSHYVRTFSPRWSWNTIVDVPADPAAQKKAAVLLASVRNIDAAAAEKLVKPARIVVADKRSQHAALDIAHQFELRGFSTSVEPTETEGNPVVLYPDPFRSKDPATYEREAKRAIEQGRKVYHAFSCFECHPAFHRNDEEWKYLAWNIKPEAVLAQRANPHMPATDKTDEYTGYKLIPPDFTKGPIKGGGDLNSLARTIGGGIGGARMPAWAPSAMNLVPRFDGTKEALFDEINEDWRELDLSEADGQADFAEIVKDAQDLQRERAALKFWSLVYYIHALIPERFGGGAERWGQYAWPPLSNFKSRDTWE